MCCSSRLSAASQPPSPEPLFLIFVEHLVPFSCSSAVQGASLEASLMSHPLSSLPPHLADERGVLTWLRPEARGVNLSSLARTVRSDEIYHSTHDSSSTNEVASCGMWYTGVTTGITCHDDNFLAACPPNHDMVAWWQVVGVFSLCGFERTMYIVCKRWRYLHANNSSSSDSPAPC